MTLQPTSQGHEKGTGRLPSPPDTRDATFTLRAMAAKGIFKLPKVIKYKRMYELPNLLPLDQGPTPRCTGFSDVTLGIAGPVLQKTIQTHEQAWELADGLWRRAQAIDNSLYGWSLGQDDGATTRSSMKAAAEKGLFGTYLWAERVEEIVDFILHHGPAIAGTPWTEQMSRTGEDGWIRVDDGVVDAQEGHQWAMTGADVKLKCPDGSKGAIRMSQTWGSWGIRGEGHAFISLNDIRKLWMAGAEFVLPVEKKLVIA